MTRACNTLQMAHNAAVKKGDVILKDDSFVMIALNDALANETITYAIAGAFDFKGGIAHTLKVGDKAYYKEDNKTVSQTDSDKFIGRVVGIYGGMVEVKININ